MLDKNVAEIISTGVAGAMSIGLIVSGVVYYFHGRKLRREEQRMIEEDFREHPYKKILYDSMETGFRHNVIISQD